MNTEPLFKAKFQIPYHIVKKNNRPIHGGKYGPPRVGKSSRLKLAEQFMYINIKKFNKLSEPISVPIHAVFKFYFNNYFVKPKSKKDPPRMSLTLGDLSGLYELPQDIMQEAKILSNDALICSHDGSRKLPSPDHNNYIEITLYEFTESMECIAYSSTSNQPHT